MSESGVNEMKKKRREWCGRPAHRWAACLLANRAGYWLAAPSSCYTPRCPCLVAQGGVRSRVCAGLRTHVWDRGTTGRGSHLTWENYVISHLFCTTTCTTRPNGGGPSLQDDPHHAPAVILCSVLTTSSLPQDFAQKSIRKESSV